MPDAARDGAAWVDYAILLAGLVTLYVIPHSTRGDGAPRFEALDRLWREHTLVSTRYSILGPLFATPLYFLGRALGNPAEVTAYFNVVLFTIFLVVFALELRKRLTRETTRLLLILLVFASMFPSHIQLFFGEVFTALMATLGILWLSRRQPWGFVPLALGVVNVPGTLVGAAFVSVRYALWTKRYRYLAAPVVMVALIRLEALVMRGDLLTTGYENDAGYRTVLPYSGLAGFSYPFFFGVLSILLSFGKGLFFFAPGVLFPLTRAAAPRAPPSLRWAQTALLWLVAGLVIVYAKWWSWPGGWFWGPRFFLVASIPSCVALAFWTGEHRTSSLPVNVLCLAALVLSFWVGVNGLVFDTTGLNLCDRDHYALEALCLYVPELSVLWHPFVDFASTVPAKTRPVALGVCAFWAIACVLTARRLALTTLRQVASWTRAKRSRHALRRWRA